MSEFIVANLGAILGVAGGYFGRPWLDSLMSRVKAWVVSKLA